jgi:hypothetical protein
MASSAQLTVAIGASPTRLAADSSSDNTMGNTLVLTNTGTVAVILGGPDVSTSNGWRGLAVGSTLILDVAEDLYAVVSGSTAGAVDVLRVR